MTHTHVLIVGEGLITVLSCNGSNVRGVPLVVVGGDEDCLCVNLGPDHSSFRLYKEEFIPYNPAPPSVEEML